MAHPKRKISKQRRAQRRTHYKAEAPTVSVCSKTGEALMPQSILARVKCTTKVM